MTYYIAITLLIVLAMGIKAFLNSRNPLIPAKDSKTSTVVFLMIAVAAIAECAGYNLNGTSSSLIPLHKAVKAIEFCLSPLLPVVMSALMFRPKHRSIPISLAVIDVVISIANLFIGFIFTIDASNVYERSYAYWVYIALYVIGFIYFLGTVIGVSERYQDRSPIVIPLVTVFLIVGVGLQIWDSSLFTSWPAAAMVAMFFSSYLNTLKLQTDSITGLLSRACYDNQVRQIDYPTVLVVFDIDDFKDVNDSLGHAIGDVCLKVIGDCLKAAYGEKALCYRIGGDEFGAILNKGEVARAQQGQEEYSNPKTGEAFLFAAPTELLSSLNAGFAIELEMARKQYPWLPDVTLGYEYFDGTGHFDEVFSKADQQLYQKKEIRKARKK